MRERFKLYPGGNQLNTGGISL